MGGLERIQCHPTAHLCRQAGASLQARSKSANYAGMAELADAEDSKSSDSNTMRVQVPLPAPVPNGRLAIDSIAVYVGCPIPTTQELRHLTELNLGGYAAKVTVGKTTCAQQIRETVSRRAHNPEITGSTPVSATNRSLTKPERNRHRT